MLTSFGGYFHAGDDYVAVGGAERAVDHQQIAPLLGHPLRGRPAAGGYFADPRADHRVALDAHKVRGGRTLYQKFIQVKNIPPKKRQLLRVAEGRAVPGTVRPATGTPRSTLRSLRALVSLAAHPLATLLCKAPRYARRATRRLRRGCIPLRSGASSVHSHRTRHFCFCAHGNRTRRIRVVRLLFLNVPQSLAAVSPAARPSNKRNATSSWRRMIQSVAMEEAHC